VFLTRRHRQVRYDLVHVHNIPDFLVFGAWFAKWTGARLVLDIHDIVPELFENKFGAKPGGSYVTLLKGIEKASAAFVDHVIVSNHLWYEKLVSRSVPRENCSVFLNHIDPAMFRPRSRTRSDSKTIILFPGSFQFHQGLDVAIRALPLIRRDIPDAELHLYGSGAAEQDLRELSDGLCLNGSVRFNPSISLDCVPEVMANADVGIVPKRADSFGNEAYSTKVMEFMSQGVPVVASRTKVDMHYFDDRVVRFFRSGDPAELAAAVLEVIRRKDLRDALIAAGYEYVDRNSWESRKKAYLQLVDTLTAEQ
jgi:glycosyltransferase involved in cell wall biosynthesis